ncbi:hypothetical protein ACFQ0G_42305 [Streptomyces chiangmaiensis]
MRPLAAAREALPFPIGSITSRWRTGLDLRVRSSHGLHPPHHHDAHQARVAHRVAAEAELVRGQRRSAGTAQGRWVPSGRPGGAVGIEFMVVGDATAQEPVAYLVPMGYRGAALEGVPGEALIGTSEHGVLGTRWIYDGVHDPVVMAQLRALLRGEAMPQHQSKSDTPDPTVTVHGTGPDDGLDVHVNRVLRPAEAAQRSSGRLVAGWTWPDGTAAQGVLAAVVPR